MRVHFIGAGPGAPDLLTLRGRDLIAACPVCLYAGSLVPKAVLSHCPEGARIVNTAPLSLDEIMAEIETARAADQDVARLHSGDLSLYSAMGEQPRRLREAGIALTSSSRSCTLQREARNDFSSFALSFRLKRSMTLVRAKAMRPKA